MASTRASGAQPWYKDRYKTVRRVAVPQNAMMVIRCDLVFWCACIVVPLRGTCCG